jgi:hypothetical protein
MIEDTYVPLAFHNNATVNNVSYIVVTLNDWGYICITGIPQITNIASNGDDNISDIHKYNLYTYHTIVITMTPYIILYTISYHDGDMIMKTRHSL